MLLFVATQSSARSHRHGCWAALVWAVMTFALTVTTGGAQEHAPKTQQNPSDEQLLMRVNVDLVQMDVVVTDSKGNHIDDLKPEDFQIMESGKTQLITNFSFISDARAGMAATGRETTTLPSAPARIAPGQANRTIAVVVDDLGVSEQSFMAIHTALEKFIDKQVGPSDLIAIITTSGRLGSLQRLTSDKRLLRAAVDKFRSLPNHRPGVADDDFTCVWYNHKASGSTGGLQDEDAWLAAGSCPECPRELDPQLELENDHRSKYYGLLSISALRRLVDGLRELPGRRSILLFTEGLPMVRGQGSGETNPQVTDGYETFLNHANRSGITVNTVDPRGLIASFDTAEVSHSSGDACQDARQTELNLTQAQLGDMAKRTGGISIINDNDLEASMAKVATDQLGYYLIGYKPPDVAKAGRGSAGFRKVAIRVTRPGVKVRYHSSLYEQAPELASTEDRGARLVAAVASPFAIPNVRTRLASRFWDAGPEAGPVLDTILEIDARDLHFGTESGGRRKAVFDILALIYGSASKPLDSFEKSYTISLTEAAYQRALREGLVQQLQLLVKQAGAYQIRGAVRDRESGRVGSASEFVEVPDLTRGRLALSGIALSAGGAETGGADSANRRRFRAGETVAYAYQVLNAQLAPDGSMNVAVTAALFRDGKALGSSAPIAINPKGQADAKRLVVSNDFRLGKQLTPGDYSLQVNVIDKNAPEKRAKAGQATDFEIVE
jgi:VWFA-related protein